MLTGKRVTFIHQHKYLRIILNKDMYDGPDMVQQIEHYARVTVLISKFITCNETVKVKLFKNILQQFL